MSPPPLQNGGRRTGRPPPFSRTGGSYGPSRPACPIWDKRPWIVPLLHRQCEGGLCPVGPARIRVRDLGPTASRRRPPNPAAMRAAGRNSRPRGVPGSRTPPGARLIRAGLPSAPGMLAGSGCRSTRITTAPAGTSVTRPVASPVNREAPLVSDTLLRRRRCTGATAVAPLRGLRRAP
jgi:hypothetical protein